MKRASIFLVIMSICVIVFTQNYQCVSPERKTYFETNTHLVYCLRIDSTSTDKRVLYPFSEIHYTDFNCFRIDIGSWLTTKIEIGDDGNSTFYNAINQPILIKSTANVNEEWEVYREAEMFITGKVVSLELKSFLGLTDYVKSISLTARNIEGDSIFHSINDMRIEISENYGLIKTINFFNFPKVFYTDGPEDLELETQVLSLIGLSNPEIGFKNVTKAEEIYDFYPGDELHIHNYCIDNTIVGGGSYDRKIVITYLSRDEDEDKIVYRYSKAINFKDRCDTLNETVYKRIFFESEPNEPHYDGLGVNANTVYNEKFTKIFRYGALYISIYNEDEIDTTCFTMPPYDCCSDSRLFIKGLGGPYYGCYVISESAYWLEYYKKGDIESGTPFELPNSVHERLSESTFNIYPNPTREFIVIENVDYDVIEVYDLTGNMVKSVVDYMSKIDVSDLQKGVYFITVKSGNNILKSKILKL